MKGKKNPEESGWIMDYLESQGVDTSCWESYKVFYNRYSARIRKYHPENYQQFLNLCCFTKQRKKCSGAGYLGDLGDYEKELYYQPREPKVKVPKEVPEYREPREPREPKYTFNEARWIKDQIKEWEQYKLRMKHYRDGRIRYQGTEEQQAGKLKDIPPYLFKFAMRCLSGTIPYECFPESINDYKEELQNILDSQRHGI